MRSSDLITRMNTEWGTEESAGNRCTCWLFGLGIATDSLNSIPCLILCDNYQYPKLLFSLERLYHMVTLNFINLDVSKLFTKKEAYDSNSFGN